MIEQAEEFNENFILKQELNKMKGEALSQVKDELD